MSVGFVVTPPTKPSPAAAAASTERCGIEQDRHACVVSSRPPVVAASSLPLGRIIAPDAPDGKTARRKGRRTSRRQELRARERYYGMDSCRARKVTMTEAIRVESLSKAFGATQALDGLDLHVEAGADPRLHGTERGRQVDDAPHPARPAARRLRRRREVLGGDPWRDATELHRRLAYVPGEVTLWPNLTGGEVIDLLGRLRGGLDPKRRAELLERFDLDPSEEGPRVLEGQPPEGRARRRPRLRRRAAAARRADRRPRPPDGGGLSRVRQRGTRRRAAPCCSRATSSPRSRRSATT